MIREVLSTTTHAHGQLNRLTRHYQLVLPVFVTQSKDTQWGNR